MTWFFSQLWLLLVLSYLGGALIAWGIALLTVPRAKDLRTFILADSRRSRQ